MPFPESTTPPFDLDAVLAAAGESRLGDAETAACRALWAQWSDSLFRRVIPSSNGEVLAVWLGKDVEDAVDAAWNDSPSYGYLLNALALALCMRAVRDVMPAIAAAGCAPVPAADEALARALTAAGLPALATGPALQLSRRYAVATPHPHGTCPACALHPTCPRRGR